MYFLYFLYFTLALVKRKVQQMYLQMIDNRNRRSVKLTTEEMRQLRKYLHQFPTKIDAALALGISRPTLDLVIIRGSGNSETVNKIRARIFNQAA